MIVIPQLLLLSATVETPFQNTRIGWDTRTVDAVPDDVTVTSESALGPKDAPLRPDSYEFWEPTAYPARWTLDFGSQVDIDYVGLLGNLGSAGVAVQVRLSEDVDDFNDYLRISGGDGNYASTPDSVAASVTGDLHLELELAIDTADLPQFSLDFLGDPDVSLAKILSGSPTVGTYTGSNGTRTNQFGLIEAAVTNVPRIDYNPLTRAIRGLFIEEARTNLLPRSREFDNGSWTKTRSSITAGATTGPDGTSSADKLVEDGTAAATHLIRQSVTKAASAIAYALTWEAKAAERSLITIFAWNTGATGRSNGNFNLATGVASTFQNAGSFTGAAGSMTHIGDGWYRCTLTFTSDTDTAVIPELRMSDGSSTNYNGDGTSGVYLGHAQIEAATFASSDIFTAGSSVTRSADIATVTDLNVMGFNASEGTIIASAEVPSLISSVRRILELNDGLSNERYLVQLDGSSVRNVIGTDGGVSVITMSTTAATAQTPFKLGFGYKANDCAVSSDGGTLATDTATSGGLPTVDRLHLGSNGATSFLNGWLRQYFYYATRRANATLQDFSRQTYRVLASKWVETGNQRSWALCLKENCALVLFISTDGTAAGIREYHSAPLTFTEGVRFRVRVQLDLATGSPTLDSVCLFQTSDDDGDSWLTVSTVTQASVSAIFDSTAEVEVAAFNGGTSEFEGKVFQFWLYSNLGDSPVLHFDAAEGVAGGTSIVSEDTGETWTIHSTGPATALTIKRFSDALAPGDDAPIMLLDESRSARRLALDFTGAFDADLPLRLAVVYAGQVLAMERAIRGGGVTPINMARETELKQRLSRGGQYLGQSFRRLGIAGSASFQHLGQQWVRDAFEPFAKAARNRPFFIAWRPDPWPLEVGYCWAPDDIRPNYMGLGSLMAVSWNMNGVGWV